MERVGGAETGAGSTRKNSSRYAEDRESSRRRGGGESGESGWAWRRRRGGVANESLVGFGWFSLLVCLFVCLFFVHMLTSLARPGDELAPSGPSRSSLVCDDDVMEEVSEDVIVREGAAGGPW